MRLSQIVETFDGNIAAQRAQRKINDLKRARKELMVRAGSLGAQGGVKPEYVERVRQLDKQMAIAKQELDQALAAPDVEAGLRADAQRAAAVQASITPEDKKRQFGQAVSKGFETWATLRDELGGDEGIDRALTTAAMKQTEDGRYPLDVDQLAAEFDIPARSLYRWIERPSLINLKRMTPMERK